MTTVTTTMMTIATATTTATTMTAVTTTVTIESGARIAFSMRARRFETSARPLPAAPRTVRGLVAIPAMVLVALSPSLVLAEPPPAATSPTPPSFWVGAAVQGDIAFLDGGEVCARQSQSDLKYACFRDDREQYLGVPEPGQPADFAVSYGTTRVMLHVERPVFDHFTLGGRFGLAFGGGATPAKGPSFLPLHVEARLAYWIGQPLSTGRGFRAFVSLTGGVAQVDASRSVAITECHSGSTVTCTPASNVQPGGANPASQSLQAEKKLGLGFAGLGAGAYYSFSGTSGALFELRVVQLFPGTGTTLSPSLAYVFHVP